MGLWRNLGHLVVKFRGSVISNVNICLNGEGIGELQ